MEKIRVERILFRNKSIQLNLSKLKKIGFLDIQKKKKTRTSISHLFGAPTLAETLSIPWSDGDARCRMPHAVGTSGYPNYTNYYMIKN